ncbi:hypothetical protein BBJ28_00006506 [Nothophytophthora sp. Chile5]|nr:hypothetical protein BBJ28_00006506 [Nothophytophthora sp. Chile5]
MAATLGATSTFHWQCNGMWLAVVPWRYDPAQQRAVQIRVQVSEQTAPAFALRFDVELLEEQEFNKTSVDTGVFSTHRLSSGRLTRLVTKQQMLQVFEFAFMGSDVQQQQRRAPLGCNGDTSAAKTPAERERRVKQWLIGGGKVAAPAKEELVQWLLSRMILVPATEARDSAAKDDDEQMNQWIVCLCGEEGVERPVEDAAGLETSNARDSLLSAVPSSRRVGISSDGSDRNADREEEAEEDDLPPPYEEIGGGNLHSPPSSLDFPDDEEGDAAEPIHPQPSDPLASKKATVDTRPAEVVRSGSSTSIRSWASNRSLNDRNGAGHSTKQLTDSRSSIKSSRDVLQTSRNEASQERLTLKPTAVRLNPRCHSLDIVDPTEPSNEWTEVRRHFQKELIASQRDLQVAKQTHDKVQRMAALRHTQLLKETARKLRRNEKRRLDARAARQLLADTLEYHEELRTLDARVKQTTIAAQREQERVKIRVRVALGNTEKTKPGAVWLGPGQLSQRDLELVNGEAPGENAVYDLHGRRHEVQEAGLVAAESALESAMRKVRRLVLQSGQSVDLFRRYDLDRSGTLSYAEFQQLLRENGRSDSAALTKEQSVAFFKHFDVNGSGEVDYGELLWGFFNRRAFLKRWRERKSASLTARDVKLLFYRFDRSGRGVLTLKEFQLVMDHLGVSLSDGEAKLLAVKFDANQDGYIDHHEFLAFVSKAEASERLDGPEEQGKSAKTPAIRHSAPASASAGMESICDRAAGAFSDAGQAASTPSQVNSIR